MSMRACKSRPCNTFRIPFPLNAISGFLRDCLCWLLFNALTRSKIYRCIFDLQLYHGFYNRFGIFLPHRWWRGVAILDNAHYCYESYSRESVGVPMRLCHIRTRIWTCSSCTRSHSHFMTLEDKYQILKLHFYDQVLELELDMDWGEPHTFIDLWDVCVTELSRCRIF